MRDYKINPLKKNTQGHFIEMPPYEELFNQYITLNKTAKECAIYFNTSEIAINRFLRRYKIHKPLELHKQNIKRLTKEKHGYENYRNIEKARQTYFDKWGVSNISKSEYFKDFIHNNKDRINAKIYNTKKRNNTFNISLVEERIYKKLTEKFDTVIRQYIDDRYPFRCDFYIPEKDLFIEYQGNWTHGGEPYIGNAEQKEKINFWASKNNDYYLKAINDWTKRDVLKRNIAKENNLNWIEFFNYNDFIDWFNKSI